MKHSSKIVLLTSEGFSSTEISKNLKTFFFSLLFLQKLNFLQDKGCQNILDFSVIFFWTIKTCSKLHSYK